MASCIRTPATSSANWTHNMWRRVEVPRVPRLGFDFKGLTSEGISPEIRNRYLDDSSAGITNNRIPKKTSKIKINKIHPKVSKFHHSKKKNGPCHYRIPPDPTGPVPRRRDQNRYLRCSAPSQTCWAPAPQSPRAGFVVFSLK